MPLGFINNIVQLPGQLIGGLLGGGGGGGGGGQQQQQAWQAPPPPPPGINTEMLLIGFGVLAVILVLK